MTPLRASLEIRASALSAASAGDKMTFLNGYGTGGEMTSDSTEDLLVGRPEDLARGRARWTAQPVDLELPDGEAAPYPDRARTLAAPAVVRGGGTFRGRSRRTLRFDPWDRDGWWMEREDLPDCLPTRVSVRNVWTTGDMVSNIVLRSGPPHNYVRMVEHIVALKLGMGLDRVMVRIDSGDPPLFDRGSLDLVEAANRAGFRSLDRAPHYVTVARPVAACSASGGFLAVHPCPPGAPRLRLDVAVDFPNAIGRQRIRFLLDEARFRYGSVARTNTTAAKTLYCRTVGRLFADVRHLGYNGRNLLVAGRRAYVNEPRLMHDGASLEAVWHRAALDLLAALALIEEGRFVGDVVSYRAGHRLDVQLVTQLYRHGLVVAFPGPRDVGEGDGV